MQIVLVTECLPLLAFQALPHSDPREKWHPEHADIR